ncbi:30S ribosomal protein S9 [Phragmitibacter flavus]|uniref:Small ribosomal subunit protein uS9 n=1 Tax=Phragmitibacter flavus TaxID=2576071 RepID=A0A5R8KA99_9BACT|nr:30S ribosomal protein S9 [Phragmitibacter flavus]TLD69224.1 30S ribosomal protein S9 [Phragmitibacter flavus]
MSVTSYNATGRRKNAVARVHLREGSGEFTINGRSFEDYFPTVALQNRLLVPLHLTNTSQNFDLKVSANGGGVTGQLGAIRMGIARALCLVNPENRPVLKQNGLLTRDSRMKERKKPGRPGARKRFQFSKR